MFDANARHLKKGTLFFATKSGDLLYCKMLDDCHKNPRIEIIASYEKNKAYNGYVDQGGKSWSFGFASFSGYVNERGELGSFINEDAVRKAEIILERIKAA